MFISFIIERDALKLTRDSQNELLLETETLLS